MVSLPATVAALAHPQVEPGPMRERVVLHPTRSHPMAHRSTLPLVSLTFTFLAAACGGGSSVSNAAPRFTEVPLQSTAGGTLFTIDLANYIADREGATLTYAVTSGGGSFAGSSYSNTFDTMGEFTVGFTVSDGMKTTAAE